VLLRSSVYSPPPSVTVSPMRYASPFQVNVVPSQVVSSSGKTGTTPLSRRTHPSSKTNVPDASAASATSSELESRVTSPGAGEPAGEAAEQAVIATQSSTGSETHNNSLFFVTSHHDAALHFREDSECGVVRSPAQG
jgi:hypothetical protein